MNVCLHYPHLFSCYVHRCSLSVKVRSSYHFGTLFIFYVHIYVCTNERRAFHFQDKQLYFGFVHGCTMSSEQWQFLKGVNLIAYEYRDTTREDIDCHKLRVLTM